MPYFDAPLEELRAYRSAVAAPDDLDEYWQEALADARARARPAVFEPYRTAVYRRLEVFDVTFTGAGGDPVRAWFLCPQWRRRAGCRAGSRSSGTAAAAARRPSTPCMPPPGMPSSSSTRAHRAAAGRRARPPTPAPAPRARRHPA